jgi:hypothetical protein
LNVEDFGGFIEISNCTFAQNMHFIPEIMISSFSEEFQRSIEYFKEPAVTKEYKLAICDTDSYTDKYFFHEGISQDDDIDSYYDKFERLSMIYISRNRNPTIIKDNIFTGNIGTFGGSISINSPNFQTKDSPYIIIHDNVFTENMAYFSGNAIYIRLTKSYTDTSEMCGGVLISYNTFLNNIGWKVHNGGAISGSCSSVESKFY